MADKLGPGSYNSSQLAIDLMILQMNDIEFQRVDLSEDKMLEHKHSSYEIAEIQASYDPEIKLIRNEMKNSGDKTSNEYFELMSELEELEDERDGKIKVIENENADKEKSIELQETSLETQYNAIKADKEGLEEAQKSDIQRS